MLHDLLVAGLNKISLREYHRPPLCDALGNGLYELRVGRKDIARAVWFFREGQRIVVVRCFVKKSPRKPPQTNSSWQGIVWSTIKDKADQ